MEQIINTSECHQIILNLLKKVRFEDILIKKYELSPKSSEVIGFMGEYYNLFIEFSIKDVRNNDILTNDSANFFVKLIPIANPLHRQEILEKGFFKKEIGIYKSILIDLEKFCDEKCFAKCYYVRPDMMVFEDLVTKNYRNLKKSENYTLDHFRRVFSSLATLHVSSMVYEFETGINIGVAFSEYLDELQVTSKNSWYTAGLAGIKTVAQRHPKYQSLKFQNFIKNRLMSFMEKAYERVELSKKYRNVFCHRDSWDRNILFKMNDSGLPDGCAFVDFQLTRYTPPAIDVMFFIYMNTNTMDRENLLENCLRIYHKDLQDKIDKSGIPETITWTEFKESCEYIKLVVLILKAMCVALTNLPVGWADEMKRKDQKKYSYYMTVNRDEMLIELMEQHKGYRDVLLESVGELVEYICEHFSIKL